MSCAYHAHNVTRAGLFILGLNYQPIEWIMRLSMSFRFCALRTQCQQAAKQVNLAPWSGVATIGQPARCRTHRLVSIAKGSQAAIYGGGRALPRPIGVPFRGPPARKAPGKSYEERKYRPLQSRFLRQGLPPLIGGTPLQNWRRLRYGKRSNDTRCLSARPFARN